MLTIFVTTILVLCASLFVLMALVPLMLEKHTSRKQSENVIPISRPGGTRNDYDLPAA